MSAMNHRELSNAIDTLFPYTTVDPIASVDSRHRAVLYELVMARKFRRRAGGWLLERLLNGGAIKAILDGAACELHLCDRRIRPEVHQLAAAVPGRVHLHECRSIEAIQAGFDFVWLDGNHSWETLTREIQLVLEHRIPNVLFHDTNASTLGYPNCEGPWMAKMLLTHLPERYPHWYLDEKPRPGRSDRPGTALRVESATRAPRPALAKVHGMMVQRLASDLSHGALDLKDSA